MSKVQGFFDPAQKTIGLWLLNGQGKVVGEFNPTGLAQPTGQVHDLNNNEEVIGITIAKGKATPE